MISKTITVDAVDYTVSTIKTGKAKTLRGSGDSYDFNVALVAASLNAGGDDSATADTVNDLDYFPVFVPLSKAAQEVNGLVPATGEAAAVDQTA